MNILPIISGQNENISEYEMQDKLIDLLHKKEFNARFENHYIGEKAKIYKEIRIPNIGRISDIILHITDRVIINIECKLSDYTTVLEQAKDHLYWADYSYICLYHSAFIPNYVFHKIIMHGIGLIYWFGNDRFAEVLPAYKNRKYNKEIRSAILKILNTKQQKITGEKENEGQLLLMKSKVKCCVCGELVKRGNSIYKKYVSVYYCKKKECQERFIEDAGERPESDYD